MVSKVWITCIIFFLVPERINSDKSNFCKTPQGDVGKCVPTGKCPYSRTSCGESDEDLVCCPAMQKIVTPNSSPAPVVETTTPPVITGPVTILPVIPPTEVTMKNPAAGSAAAAKCEEYKHRVKKRGSIVTYVFGGSQSLGREFPHMAILGYGKPEQIQWLCGGSLISDRFVVTAAHCIINSNLNNLIRVRLGELDLQSIVDDADPIDFGIAEKIVHPNYRLPSEYNDIALIKLDSQVQFNAYVAPICLQTNRNLPNTKFIATGWGRTEMGESQSDILMKVDLEYFPNRLCQRNYNDIPAEFLPQGIADDTQICAGSYSEDKDTCQGDSGGPLQIRDDALYLVGITSFGKACGVPNSPAVYTRVSYYVPWIEEIVWQ